MDMEGQNTPVLLDKTQRDTQCLGKMRELLPGDESDYIHLRISMLDYRM